MTQIQIIGLLMYRTKMRVDHWGKTKGFTKSTVYRVISKEMTKGQSTERVRKAISAAVRKDQIEIWPEEAKTK